MAKLTKLQVFGVKTETTQGTTITLTATDYMLVSKAEAKPVAEIIPREYKRASLSQLASILGKLHVEIEVECELKGSSARGTPHAPLGALLQACSLVETISVGTLVAYAPTSVAASASFFGPGKSCTISVYENGLYHSIAGCIATSAKISMKAGNIAVLSVKLRGLYAAVTDTTFPTATYTESVKPPVFASAAFTVDSYSAVISALEIDFGLEVANRESGNAAYGVLGFQNTGRKFVGSMDVEASSVAGYDFFGKLVSRGEYNVNFVLTGASGNILTFALPKAQYSEVSYGDANGIRMFKIPLQFNQSTGDDEMTLTIT